MCISLDQIICPLGSGHTIGYRTSHPRLSHYLSLLAIIGVSKLSRVGLSKRSDFVENDGRTSGVNFVYQCAEVHASRKGKPARHDKGKEGDCGRVISREHYSLSPLSCPFASEHHYVRSPVAAEDPTLRSASVHTDGAALAREDAAPVVSKQLHQ